MYDVLPHSGSLAGGTEVTIKTSSLTAARDLGFTTCVITTPAKHDLNHKHPSPPPLQSPPPQPPPPPPPPPLPLTTPTATVTTFRYDVNFIEDEEDGISKYIAAYLGLDTGIACDVTNEGEGEDEIRCITRALDADAWLYPEDVADQNLYPFLVAEWNANEIYSLCADRSNNDALCRFRYSKGNTPILKVNTNGSTFFLHQKYFGEINENPDTSNKYTQILLNQGGQVYALTEGDRIRLSYNYNSSDFRAYRNDPANVNVSYYNWSAVDQAVNGGADNGIRSVPTSPPPTELTTTYHHLITTGFITTSSRRTPVRRASSTARSPLLVIARHCSSLLVIARHCSPLLVIARHSPLTLARHPPSTSQALVHGRRDQPDHHLPRCLG